MSKYDDGEVILMNQIVKECHELMTRLGSLPLDQAMPTMQDGLWEIAARHNTTGDEVFKQYMDWKSKQ